MIDISRFGLRPEEKTDRAGRRIIDLPVISMQVLIDQETEVTEWVWDCETKHGPGRLALHVVFYGKPSKIITNSIGIKNNLSAMERIRITRFAVVFIDKGSKKYEMTNVRVIEIDHRPIAEVDEAHFLFTDTNEKWSYEDWTVHCQQDK